MKKRSTTYRLNKVDYSIFIIFSLAAAAMLFLFYRDLNSFTIKQSEEPVAKIYFKKNTAQRKFIDNDIWEVLTNSSDIYDGDRIRTSKDSEAYTEFNDTGIQIQLREKSMVQIFKNKKQRSVDFIGGEIFVANNSPEEKLVIHSGKKEIAVTKASEVKIALPEVSEAVVTGEEAPAKEDNTVIVEVVTGKVEITEIPEAKPKIEKNEKVEKTEPEPIIVSAGETVTLVPEVEKTEPAPVVEEITVTEEAPVEEETIEIEETVEEEPEVEEAVVEEPVAPVVKEKVKTPEPVKPAPKVEVAEEKPVIPPEPVEQGLEHLLTRPAAMFKKSVWDPVNKRYNYSTGFSLSEIAGNNKTLPAGSVIEFSLSGTPNKDLNNFAIQISTGEEEWAQAHPFVKTYPNNGTGMLADISFNSKTTIMLTKDIVNSDNSFVNICYDPEVLDEPVIVRDFLAKVRVLSTNGKVIPVRSGYSKTLEYRDLTIHKSYWGQKSDEYNYKLAIRTEDIFNLGGGVWAVSIPKGSTVKITIDGICDSDIDWCHPEFIDNTDDKYVNILQTDNDAYKNRFNEKGPIKKNKRFNYSREYTAEHALTNSLGSEFDFIMDQKNLKEDPILKDLTITIEVY